MSRLIVSHGCFDGPVEEYRAFIAMLEKHRPLKPRPLVNIDHLMGEWEKTPDEPLDVLLDHCAYSGVIWPRDGRYLCPRLTSLLEWVKPEHVEVVRVFAQGVGLAYEAREKIRYVYQGNER